MNTYEFYKNKQKIYMNLRYLLLNIIILFLILYFPIYFIDI